MANEEQLAMLKSGVEAWNTWRRDHVDAQIDLVGADLVRAPLLGANLRGADLRGARLDEAVLNLANLSYAQLNNQSVLAGAHLDRALLDRTILTGANLSKASLNTAHLIEANLIDVDLTEAHLVGAHLRDAHLERADLAAANLSGAHLNGAYLINAHLEGAYLHDAVLTEAHLNGAILDGAVLLRTDLEGADLTGCHIHGIAAWDLKLDEATSQADVIITRDDQPTITVDNLEVAQFVYLLLNNQRIRHVIDTITSKAVLILGRFTQERKAVLHALRDELRRRDYLPILFDFDKPASRNLTETVRTLASLARFVIADLTDARSIPQELMAIVPNLPSVPVQPLLLAGASEYAMFDDFRQFSSVLPVYEYGQIDSLLAALPDRVIAPAERKAKELQPATPGRQFG